MTALEPHPAARRTVDAADAVWRRILSGSWVPVTAITILLFAISPLVAPGSIGTPPVMTRVGIPSVWESTAAK